MILQNSNVKPTLTEEALGIDQDLANNNLFTNNTPNMNLQLNNGINPNSL